MFTKICFIGIISLIILVTFSNENVNAEPINKIPSWVEILDDWWLEEIISDTEFVQSLTYLTNNEIIKISKNENEETNFFNSISREESEIGNFSIFYMSIEDYGNEPYPGRISPPDPRSKDIEPEKIEMWLHQNQYFEKQITFLNEHVKLPKNVIIGLGECQEKKAFYNKNTKMIVICYELIFDVYDKLTEEYKTKGISEKQISKITLDVVDFIFYHQVSHAIIEIISNNENSTITNNDEYFVDSLSNHIKLLIQKDKEKYSIVNISLWFKIMHEVENLEKEHMWNIHFLNLERLSKIACQDSSFNSTVTLDYIQKGILTKQNIIECKSKWLEDKEKLEKISDQILK
jgi:hypothetical protein